MRWQCGIDDDVVTPANRLGSVLLVGTLVLVALVDEPVRRLRLLAREAPESDGRLQGGRHPPQPTAHRREETVLLSTFLRTKRKLSALHQEEVMLNAYIKTTQAEFYFFFD